MTIDIFDDVMTCSNKMRDDIIEFMGGNDYKMLEIGTSYGYTNFYLSGFFNHIYGTEISDEAINFFNKNNKVTNNEIIKFNVYNDDWAKLPDVDVVFIDCDHSYNGCKSDIQNTLTRYPNIKYIIFDDYEVWEGVNEVVSEYITDGIFKVEKLIGLNNIVNYLPKKGMENKGKQEGIIISII